MSPVSKIVEVGTRRYWVRTSLSGSGSDVAKSKHSKPVMRQQIPVAQGLHKFIIGAQGATINGIRKETNARIIVGDLVEVEGSADEVAAACQRIQQIVDANIQKMPYTHFLSLPISDMDVQRQVGTLQDDVRHHLPRNLIHSSMCVPATLHITIGMLRLPGPAEITKAADLLKSLQPQVYGVLNDRPLVIKIGGLAAMEANPAKARTIYAGAQDFSTVGDDRLVRVCEVVRSAFDRAGFIDEKRELKIHVSVIRAKGATFDATQLVKKHGDQALGTCRIGRIEVARRFGFTGDGAYDNDGALALP
ncbi:activating signal cointegrator 1 complex subunit [Coemansia sp. BCRC 34301]|nr:activating signal cointegrator 1 complex subunit [Coemansia sp. BCRC 34301]